MATSASASDKGVAATTTPNLRTATIGTRVGLGVTATKGEPYLDQATIKLTFTEKDHSKEKKPHILAGFGRFGSALIITVKMDGKIIGCEVAHSAHEKSGFSSLGSIEMSDFKVADGKVSGKIATKGEVDTFKQTWEVKISFSTKAP